ncbi:hypothetical protein P8C59_006679 [Phyllachora maydis]|uniref:Uncharacterized protein n=1 Tax=Phyllachora maydis TaxID=1825666 RepID=A0AAD9I6T7_9PEZI|nr:hypothetical protein P8C59_006679 [Phyllachora maydis]
MKKVQLLASALYFASIGAHLQERTTTLNGSCSTGDASAPNHGAYSMLEMDKIVRAYSSPELDGQVLTLAPKQSDASHFSNCGARDEAIMLQRDRIFHLLWGHPPRARL